MYGSGSADNVKTTCNWHDQVKHARARAKSRAYKLGNSSRLSAMCKRSTQGVEAYMYAGSVLGRFLWVMSGAFPGGLG